MTLHNFSLLVSGNAPVEFPTDIFFAVLWQNDEDALAIQPIHPFRGEWGYAAYVFLNLIPAVICLSVGLMWAYTFEMALGWRN